MNLEIAADDIYISTSNGSNKVNLDVKGASLDFLDQMKTSDIISNCDNKDLFEKIIENDGEVLQEYLRENGYIWNKA